MKKKNKGLFGFFQAFMSLFVFAMYAIEDGAGSAEPNEEQLLKKINNIIDKRVAGLITQTDFESKIEKAGVDKDEVMKQLTAKVETLNGSLEKQGLQIAKFNEGVEVKGYTGAITKSITDNLTQINTAYENKSGQVSLLTIKAVGDISTGNALTAGTFSALHEMINSDDIRGTRLRQPWIEEFATVTRTGKATYSYTEYEPKEGDADFVLEGGSKPQIDIKATTRSITPVKAAGHSVLSEEARDDVPRMESEARVVIAKKVALRRQNGILFGDGTGANPIGLTTIAQAFNAASWTGEKVTDANLKDAIIAAANQIYTTHNYVDEENYAPNLVVLNPGDYHSFLTKKDADNNYMFMNIPLAGGASIEGMGVIHHRDIPAGKILIGDFTMLNVINYIDYALRLGWINAQFITNEFTMVGESRFFTYVRNLDEVAFIYDDISNITDGIQVLQG